MHDLLFFSFVCLFMLCSLRVYNCLLIGTTLLTTRYREKNAFESSQCTVPCVGGRIGITERNNCDRPITRTIILVLCRRHISIHAEQQTFCVSHKIIIIPSFFFFFYNILFTRITEVCCLIEIYGKTTSKFIDATFRCKKWNKRKYGSHDAPILW